LVEHNPALFSQLKERGETLFRARFEVLRYDLTSTDFECDADLEPAGLQRFGYSRDTRPDCVPVILALVVPPEGFPLAYRQQLRHARLREGRYVLRSHLTATAPATRWTCYIQLTEVEHAFKELKNDLSVRPLYHQLDRRIEAHMFVAVLAYGLHVTRKARLRPLAGGLPPRSVIEQFAGIQMRDVRLPLTDGRALTVTRDTEPEQEHHLLRRHMHLALPCQPPPRISAPI
jgi:hypothetical protein